MAIKPLHNESELLLLLSKGDRKAFAVLFDAYYSNLGTYAYKITESREAAEEIVQDTFLKVWEKREQLSNIDSFTGYLFILLKNKTLNYLKKKAREDMNHLVWCREFIEEPYEMGVVAHEDTYGPILDEAVASLPPQQQRVYHLSRYEHLKYEEIALTMGLSKETVKKHMHLALKQLKEFIRNRAVRSMVLLLIFLTFF